MKTGSMNKLASKASKASTRIRTPRDRRGVRSDKPITIPNQGIRYNDPTVCDSCGAMYTRKSWRKDHPVTHSMLEQVEWAKCPACRQKSQEIAYGRIVIRGEFPAGRLTAIQRRIRNVESRATHTQPENSVVSMDKVDGGLDVLTTSQQLAHRIVNELKKAFGGRAIYRWSDADGALYARWSG